MAHLNPDGIDLVVSAFLVYNRCVALVDHIKLGCWLALGGHVEMNETPDEALYREIGEEAGLVHTRETREYQIIDPPFCITAAKRPAFDPTRNHNSQVLHPPWCIDIHDFPPVPGHRHMALVYFGVCHTPKLVLEPEAARGIRWFSARELDDPALNTTDFIRWYGKQAIEFMLAE